MNDDNLLDPSRRALLAGAASLAAMSQARAKQRPGIKHVVLLGDSIFDNKAYVGGGPDVMAQVQEALPQDWVVSLAAIDGATTADVKRQVGGLSEGATHLVVSAGGNDALGHEEVLDASANSVGDALDTLSKIRIAFQENYAAMLDVLAATQLPLAVCTIYDSNYEALERRRIANTALAIFNDVITREAFARGLPLIDLRLIFDSPADYANPVEPSVIGGAKLAKVIAKVATTHDFKQRQSEVYA